MVSHLFYYQLALLAILWLFVMLHVTWAEPGLTTPAVPAQPKRKRSTEPHPFAGLTHKPHCVLCQQETGETHPPPPIRPDPMPLPNRRPRTVDTSMHFCPHTDCDYRQIPSDFVVTPCVFHNTLDISTRYPHSVS